MQLYYHFSLFEFDEFPREVQLLELWVVCIEKLELYGVVLDAIKPNCLITEPVQMRICLFWLSSYYFRTLRQAQISTIFLAVRSICWIRWNSHCRIPADSHSALCSYFMYRWHWWVFRIHRGEWVFWCMFEAYNLEFHDIGGFAVTVVKNELDRIWCQLIWLVTTRSISINRQLFRASVKVQEGFCFTKEGKYVQFVVVTWIDNWRKLIVPGIAARYRLGWESFSCFKVRSQISTFIS